MFVAGLVSGDAFHRPVIPTERGEKAQIHCYREEQVFQVEGGVILYMLLSRLLAFEPNGLISSVWEGLSQS